MQGQQEIYIVGPEDPTFVDPGSNRREVLDIFILKNLATNFRLETRAECLNSDHYVVELEITDCQAKIEDNQRKKIDWQKAKELLDNESYSKPVESSERDIDDAVTKNQEIIGKIRKPVQKSYPSKSRMCISHKK